MSFGVKLLLFSAAFFSGLIGMSLEILGARIFSPHFGLSTGIWTVLIGTVLFFMSLGYIFGGYVADKKNPFSLMSALFLGAAFTLSLGTLNKFVLLKYLSLNVEPFYLAAFLGCFGTIGLPSFFLAALFPVLFQTIFYSVKKSVHAAAAIVSVSAIGSLMGTFFTGLFLLEYFGHSLILRFYVVLLVGLSVLFFVVGRFKSKQKSLGMSIGILSIAFIFFDSFPDAGIKDIDTRFSRYWIFDQRDSHNVLHRVISSGRGSYQGEMIFGRDKISYSPYLDFFSIAFQENHTLNKALLLGGGVLLFPQIFSQARPQAQLDIVEIDPQLTDIAKKYFNYVPNSHHKIIAQDARVFINARHNGYDVIFVDIFKGLHIPFYMLTVEALTNLKEALTQEGFVLVNLLQGDRGTQFLASVIKSFQVVFPYVYPFKHPQNDGDINPNWTLLASLAPWDFRGAEQNKLFRFYDPRVFETTETLVFSDDYTPRSIAP